MQKFYQIGDGNKMINILFSVLSSFLHFLVFTRVCVCVSVSQLHSSCRLAFRLLCLSGRNVYSPIRTFHSVCNTALLVFSYTNYWVPIAEWHLGEWIDGETAQNFLRAKLQQQTSAVCIHNVVVIVCKTFKFNVTGEWMRWNGVLDSWTINNFVWYQNHFRYRSPSSATSFISLAYSFARRYF